MDISAPVLSVHKLLEIKRDILENLQTEHVETLTDLDARLHSYIVDTSGKKRLINMLSQLYRLLQKFRSLGYLEPDSRKQALQEHIDIIDALSMRDTVSAKALMKKHIENSKIIALSQLFKTRG
jgi:DNA-binding GntR family transcriptional regulator